VVSDQLTLGLDQIADEIHRIWAETKTHQVAAWEGYFATGHLLLEARSRFPSDTLYGRWFAAQEFGFKSAWAGRLMAVAREEPKARELLDSGLSSAVDSLVEMLRPPRLPASAGPLPALPAGKFAVLLADPPWRYDFIEADNRAIENQYPTLTADEIVGYRDADERAVTDLPGDDAVLFLWATNPKVPEAMRVLEGWGFRYVTNLAWVKDRIGMGYWARQRHELLLVGVRGEFSPPPEHLRPGSVIEAPRRAHSQKPPAVHEFIEAVWPHLPKVEVFAREPRPGWAGFGNQLKAVA
jgi:N6-adenosine-specific RNA methylase IME4